jgi:multidrug efflux pump subunit AcrA (membrane-fusion protein)
MTTTFKDLSSLARTETGAAVAVPKYPWKTRVGIPALVILLLVGLMAYAGRDALRPTVDVRVVPVVLKAGSEAAGSASAPSSGAIVQAAGWVEADPYPVAVSALAEGIVKEVLVLEGQPIKAGQVVARLVADDAKLALARAQAELLAKQAELSAAQRNWDNPVERVRAEAAAEGASRRRRRSWFDSKRRSRAKRRRRRSWRIRSTGWSRVLRATRCRRAKWWGRSSSSRPSGRRWRR